MRKKIKRAGGDGMTIASALMFAPMVMALRIPLMAAEAKPGSKIGAETMKAGAEKAEAVAEGLFAAQLSMAQSASDFWLEAASGRVPWLFNGIAAERAVHAALRPASRRVSANFRRLSAKKR